MSSRPWLPAVKSNAVGVATSSFARLGLSSQPQAATKSRRSGSSPGCAARSARRRYVRVGTFSSETILGGWYKTIAVVKDAYGDPVGLQNGEFTNDLIGNWTLVNNFNGDMRDCAGNCKFKFVGGLNESTKLQQVRQWPTAVLLVRPEHVMRLYWYIQTSPSPMMKIQLILIYSDGTPSTKSYFYMTTEQPALKYMGLTASFESPNIKKVKVSFTNKATSGTAYIDSVTLDYGGGLLRDSVLPLPVPAQ